MTEIAPPQSLRGMKVMVVEDQFLVAEEHTYVLEQMGAQILGPFGTVAEALAGLEQDSPDFAVLDVNLEGEKVFPVAAELVRRETPFMFVTGYEEWVLPQAYHGRPMLEKLFSPISFNRALAELKLKGPRLGQG